MRIALIISPNYKDYAWRFLETNLISIREQRRQPDKLFLVDNESSSESMQYLKQQVSSLVPNLQVEFLSHPDNIGFAGGNNLALRAVIEQNYDYAVCVNMDGRLDQNFLLELESAAERTPEAGVIQARIMMWPAKHMVNSLGNVTHFLGFGYCQGYRQSIDQDEITRLDLSPIAYASGAAVMYKIDMLKTVGLYDENLWMYNEDQDLSWRSWLNGQTNVLASKAVFYHQYEFSRSTSKYYWMDRNRLINILKHYKIATLILIFPALILANIGMILSSWRGGWLKEFIKSQTYFWKRSSWEYLKQARLDSKKIRTTSDRNIIKLFSGHILYQEIDSPLVRIGNKFFNAYFKIIKKIIFW